MNSIQSEKAVLISIHPKWCELIANGEKTVEIRKTKPKIKPPFKVYIYCTKDKCKEERLIFQPFGYELGGIESSLTYKANGKVIGEFICDSIEWIGQGSLVVKEDADKALAGSCLTREEIFKYLGLPRKQGDDKYRECYGWHISNLIIYDKPKELIEFFTSAKCPYQTTDGCTYNYHCYRAGKKQRCGQIITKPPQSWCYVNEERKTHNERKL